MSPRLRAHEFHRDPTNVDPWRQEHRCAVPGCGLPESNRIHQDVPEHQGGRDA